MNEIEILKDLVAFNTIEDKENIEILDYIQNYLTDLGFELVKRDKYLVMNYGQNPKLGFIGHSDTVEFIEGWDTDPHTLTQKDNTLYGLGCCDMKGGIACFLAAISKLDLASLKFGIQVGITYDEEIGFGGIKDIIKDNIKIPEYVIVGEPTANVCQTGCKGLFAVRFFTNGIKVHSSTPNRGKSANSSMIKFLLELEEYYNEYIKVETKDIFEIPYTTMNIGLINGGSAINSVAAECMSYVDFRTVKSEHVEMLKAKIEELCQKYDGRYEIDECIYPFDNTIEFIKEKNTAGFMTEASLIEGKRMILGPGPMTAHEVNEHVTVESLEKCVSDYIDIINEVCN